MAARIPFVRSMDFEYGRVDQVSPLIRRVIAKNPSPYTFHGTGTYIIGQGEVAVIDPGPLLDDHLRALHEALAGEVVSHILVTHTHNDHSPLAKPLSLAIGAPTYGFGPHGSGRAEPAVKVEEGGDRSFRPDHALRDGDVIGGAGWTLEVLHTPGHTSNHLCFALSEEQAFFPGDHVMGWSTTVVVPPDGDMQAYRRSLERLLERPEVTYWPTHGPPITAPRRHLEALIAHRAQRDREICEALRAGLTDIPGIVERVYAEVPRHLHAAAAQTVLAHLIHLVEIGLVDCEGPPEIGSRFALRP